MTRATPPAAGHRFASGSARWWGLARYALTAELPGTDLVYLNVQRAFDDVRGDAGHPQVTRQ
ncbi:hypothetical protein QTQ03_01250 [Micromonospora sp. WMMA1363]|uniref:hypothetical protein n=1 Tax=Micromonospora sp. WMMA1363 TaxID=3053985 RepID=UPI00259C7C04|nr:hypothetical protein [Micromonospora sp. WMMA1363]MDM4718276.1 hypothetical protein [Micromonospora sp. WMMA1363]